MDLKTTLQIAETIDGWMTRCELSWLFSTARSLPPESVWVELGIWKGRSFFAVAMGLPHGAHLVGVDSFTETATALPFVPTRNWVRDHFRAVLAAVRRLRPDLQIRIIRRDIGEAAAFCDVSTDIVFFDGDHSREGLARELATWVPKIKPNGLLCGHDYNVGFPGVIQTVDATFPNRSLVPDTSIWTVRHEAPRPAATLRG
jgi:hypothetical protein